MKRSRVVTFTCFLVCAVALGVFICSAQATTIATPAKVVVTPKGASVVIGKTQGYSAEVLDKDNKKITGLTLDWAVSTAAGKNGCSIDPSSGVLTVADTANVGAFKKGVIATVSGTQVSGTADFNVETVFTGTYTPGNSQNGGYIAMDLIGNSGHLLAITPLPEFFEFPIEVAKEGKLSGSFTKIYSNRVILFEVGGQLEYTGGVPTSASGKYKVINTKSGKVKDSGNWTATVSTATGAGGKLGRFTIPATTTPKASAISGDLAAVFMEDGSIFGVAEPTKGGAVAVSGALNTPSADDVDFTSFAVGAASNASATGTGTYDPSEEEASGQLFNAGSAQVGTWEMKDISK